MHTYSRSNMPADFARHFVGRCETEVVRLPMLQKAVLLMPGAASARIPIVHRACPYTHSPTHSLGELFRQYSPLAPRPSRPSACASTPAALA